MNTECKVCKSEKREYIEQLILQGNSNLAVSLTLKDMNEDISHASINRHKTKHMADYAEKVKEVSHEKGNRKYDKDDSKNLFIIDTKTIYNEIENEISSLNYDKSANSFIITSLILDRIAKNQCAIVLNLQEKYIIGECKYPYEQINGLEKIQNLIIKHETFQNKVYEYMKEVDKKRMELFKYENRHLNNEMEIKKWFEKRPYVKGHIFNLIEFLNYDIDKVCDAVDGFYTLENVNTNEYRSEEYIKDWHILNCLWSLAECGDINKIKAINDLLIVGKYEAAFKDYPDVFIELMKA